MPPDNQYDESSSGSAVGSLPYILLVDDNVDDAFFFAHAIKRLELPIRVEHVRNGQSAVERLDNLPGERFPAMVVLDLDMPRLDGFDALRRIRAQPRFQKLSIVVFSSAILDSDRPKAERLGANAYYSKPTGFPEFDQVVSSLLFWLKPGVLPDSPRLSSASS
jgi:CheY-like chemotaxis protein